MILVCPTDCWYKDLDQYEVDTQNISWNNLLLNNLKSWKMLTYGAQDNLFLLLYLMHLMTILITSVFGVVAGWDEQKPSDKLPNQDMNQYWTVYWWETVTMYTKGADRKTFRSLGRGWTEIGANANNTVGMKSINSSLFEMNYFRWVMITINNRLFEMTLTCR